MKKLLFTILFIYYFIRCINYTHVPTTSVTDNSVTYKITTTFGIKHEYRIDISKYTIKRLNGSAQYCIIHEYPEIVVVREKEGKIEYIVRRWAWFE